jgi:hypothetical protein
VVLLVALVSAGWWVWNSGLFATQERAVQAPPTGQTEAAGDPAPTPGRSVSAADDDSWIPLFDPADPTTVTASSDASAAAAEQDGEAFVQARSGASGTPVRFAVGEGALQSIAGTQAVFRISASADEEEGETQITVQCDFAGAGRLRPPTLSWSASPGTISCSRWSWPTPIPAARAPSASTRTWKGERPTGPHPFDFGRAPAR